MADYTFTAGQTIEFGRKDTELIHLWDFGDGITSTDINPLHVYSSLGIYTVTHTAWNSCGTCVGGTTRTVEIVSNISTPSAADYKFVLGEETHFNRRDTELIHLWDFGDGITSTNINPLYIYSIPGIYTVTHTAWNPCGTCVGGVTHTVEILQAPGTLDVSSVPSGAKIIVDNVDTGSTTPATIPILPGPHTITLILGGHEDSVSTVNITSQQTTVLGITLQPITCPSAPKYSGDTVTLKATPKDGIGPYYVEFKKGTTVIASYPNIVENTDVTYDYILTDADIAGSGGTITFSVFISDSCPLPLGPKTCEQTCIITIGCIAPVCNFTVT